MPGIVSLAADATNVSKHCFWVMLNDEELDVPFSELPRFKSATNEKLSDVVRPTENHLY